MILDEVIAALKAADQSYVPPMGFCDAHSYRGDYSDLGVAPSAGVSVADMVETLEGALGCTFVGWKGGSYKMDGFVYVHIAEKGNVGDRIGPVLLAYLTGDFSKVPMRWGE